MSKEKGETEYWKNNCEMELLKTPISVLRYITRLEEELSNAVAPSFHNRILREQEERLAGLIDQLKEENERLKKERIKDRLRLQKMYDGAEYCDAVVIRKCMELTK